jgi:hypothetical protein
MKQKLLAGILGCALCVPAFAHERLFTYSYEPETMPQGLFEFEQGLTLRTQRNKAVGQQNYNKWQFRESIEYGVTDNYTIEGYLNFSQESFRDPVAGTDSSSFHFDGVSIENRYMLVNPIDHLVGVTLYLEPTFSGDEAELEQKIIIGQRHGDWKWAFNLTHATEWEDNLHEVEGEFEGSFGLAYNLNKQWAIGAEFRNHNELPEYNEWENTAFYLGPVVSYHNEKFWGALTVMPQIYGANFSGDPDLNHHFELEGHEKLNVRLIFGITF